MHSFVPNAVAASVLPALALHARASSRAMELAKANHLDHGPFVHEQ
jgi:hypothetical protein